MKTLNAFEIVIRSVLYAGIVLLIGQTSGYGGEFEPVVPGVVNNNSLEIIIKNFDFTNEGTGSVGKHLLVLPAGMEVTWVNMQKLTTINGDMGLMPHGIWISDESEKVFAASPILTQEHNSFRHTFGKTGTFSYGCFIHPFMAGKIVVVSMPNGGAK